MREVVVLGGYGRLGRLCVKQVVERTRARVIVAGPNIQRAEAVSLNFGERAGHAYCNALDPRTAGRLLEGKAALITCCGGELRHVIDVALSLRVPVIALSALPLDDSRRMELGERAWQAQVPVVLQAGCVPGLPNVCADLLMRQVERADELRIAAVGTWSGGGEANGRDASAARGRWLPQRFEFPAPFGLRSVAPVAAPDLEGFAARHLVQRVRYLEPSTNTISRGLDRIFGREEPTGFALVGEARNDRQREPLGRIEICAPEPLTPAATVGVSLLCAILAGGAPAGSSTIADVLSGDVVLGDLEKHGARITRS